MVVHLLSTAYHFIVKTSFDSCRCQKIIVHVHKILPAFKKTLSHNNKKQEELTLKLESNTAQILS